jgi:predicted negative regulator of RcsB-dependent stress response
MLKPKKNITQKEIQRDPFLETVDQAQAHFEDNKSFYAKIITGALVALLGFFILNKKNSEHNINASVSLGQALVALEQSDLSNAKFQLETVIDDYSGTPSSINANYFLGKVYFDEGDYPKSKKLISTFYKKSSNDMMLTASAQLLAEIEVQNSNNPGAIEILKKAIRSTALESQKNALSLSQAKIFISIGDDKKALASIDLLLASSTVSSAQKQAAEELLGKIAS